MKEIVRRLRQLEQVRLPLDRDQATAAAILAARRQRLGPNYEPPHFPPENYAGCPRIADRIVRCRQLLMERDRQREEFGIVPNAR